MAKGLKYRQDAYQMLRDIEPHLEGGELRPSPELVENVKKVVNRLLELSELPVHVDKTSLGDILVTAFNENPDTLMIYCASEGEVECRLTRNCKTKKRFFDSIDSLLDSTYVPRAMRLLSSR